MKWENVLTFIFSICPNRDCAKLFASFHSVAAENKLVKAVYRKYSHPQRSGVAFLQPAKVLLAAADAAQS